jgi:hypothetical protein
MTVRSASSGVRRNLFPNRASVSMKFDPIKELDEILKSDDSPPDESLPAGYSGSREASDQTFETAQRPWFSYLQENQAKWNKIATESYHFLNDWFLSWTRIVLTGCVIGLMVGLSCRAILLQN